jgi:hypothetical protein
MPEAKTNKLSEPSKNSALVWDKTLLLAFIAVLSLLLIVLNREANSFLSDARLYPYVMSIIGLVLSALSIVRVIMGREPTVDPQSGKDWDLSAEHTRDAYQKTLIYLLMFCGFYLGIWLFGFRLAAGVFVFGFIHSFGHSYGRSALYALAGLAMLEGLSRLLSLTLPNGLVYEFLLS